MKLVTLRGQGLTRFDAFDVDFDAVGPGLIAITGPNGAGKTTLLEASGPATLFRELPTRSPSPLPNWVSPDGGELELRFELGSVTYVARVVVAKGGQVKAFLNHNGRPIVSGKVREYDAEIAKVIGPSSAFYASVFGAQGGTGRFSDLPVRDRKAIFRYYLPEMVHAQRLSDAANERLKLVDTSEMERLERQGREAVEEATALRKDIETDEQARMSVALQLSASEEAHGTGSLMVDFRQAVQLARDAREEIAALDAQSQASTARGDLEKAEDDLRRVHKYAAQLDEAGDERDMAARSLRMATDELERLERAAGLLKMVPCKGEGQFASCPLLDDAQKAARQVSSKRHACRRIEGIAKDCEAALNAKRDEAASVPYQGSGQAAGDAVREARAKAGDSAEQIAQKRGAWQRSYEAHMTRARELKELLPATGTDPNVSADDVAAMGRRVDELKRQERDLRDRINRQKGTLEGLEATEKKAAKKLASLQKANADVAPLRVLRDTFGANGVQAYLLDAAGPEVTELVNGLLHHCYGHRFTVRVVTLRELKSKGGTAEDFDVFVTDARSGREGSIDGLSGGEKVIVDEALRTGLSLYAAQRRSVKVRTLWRDETVGDLDADNSTRYVAMLQRAREIGDYHQVLFVTHSPEAVAAADAVLRIDEGGRITLERN